MKRTATKKRDHPSAKSKLHLTAHPATHPAACLVARLDRRRVNWGAPDSLIVDGPARSGKTSGIVTVARRS